MKNLKYYAIAVALVIAIFLGVIGVKQHQRISALEDEVASHEPHSASIQERAKRVIDDQRESIPTTKRAREAIAQLRRLETIVFANVEEEKTEPTPQRGQRKSAKQMLSGQDLVKKWEVLMGDTAVAEEVDAQLRLQINRRYAALIGEASLAQSQKENFITLILEKRKAAMSLASDALHQGKDPFTDTKAFASAVAASRAAIDEKKIRALLGGETYARFEAMSGLHQESILIQLRDSLEATSNPLTDKQIDEISTLLEANKSTHINQNIIDSAAKFLSEPQLQALKQIDKRTQHEARKQPPEQTMNAAMPVAIGTPSLSK